MGAVGVSVEDNGTACQTGLMSRALDVMQPDGSTACAEPCPSNGRFSEAAAQLQAHHVSLPEVPAMVAHGPPLLVAAHLNSSGTVVTSIH